MVSPCRLFHGCGADSSTRHVSAGRSGLRAIQILEFRTEILVWKVSFDSSRREASEASAIELNSPIFLILAGNRLKSVQRSCMLSFLSFIRQPVQYSAHIYSCIVTISRNIPTSFYLL